MSHPPDYAIKRLSLPETLAHSLRERILNGEFAEGDQIRQEAIASEYKVSRMPVREALRQLEALGLIEIHIHRGAVVKTLPLAEVEELFELRAMLECDALTRALPNFTDAHLKAAAAVLARLEGAYRDNDVQAWGALNTEFHASLYTPSARNQTLTLIAAINTQTDRLIRMQLTASQAIARAEEDHRELLRLCRARDPAAIPFLHAHIMQAAADLQRVVAASRTR